MKFAFLPALVIGCLPLAAQEAQSLTPVDAEARFNWTVQSTVGPAGMTAGLFSAGLGTLLNRPVEYGTHFDGFGRRYGMRLTGVATSNVMEAGIGAAWGEDPRYHPAAPGTPVTSRLGRVVKWTFVAANHDGEVHPAYARFIAISGSNFLSSTWREPSEADFNHGVQRIGLGFVGRMAGNAFTEFFPDAQRRLFRRSAPKADPFL